jgi:hypothetical protein
LWTLYHGYDSLTCTGWACRSIRAQKISWDANGLPLLGYPLNPGVNSWAPSGDVGSLTGWGGAHSGAAASEGWTYNSSTSVDSPATGSAGKWQQTFHGDRNPIAYSVSIAMQLDAGSNGQYGAFAHYDNAANHVEAYIDTQAGMFVSSATINGNDQGQRSASLPADFDITVAHTITVQKSAANLFAFSLDGMVEDVRTINVGLGQVGLLASGSGAHFRGIALADNSFGWGDAYGDAAEGLPRTYTSLQPENGYVHGSWTIQDGTAVNSSSAGGNWNTIYQGNPNFSSYTVQVDAQLGEAGGEFAPPRFGLIACHDDRDNHVSMWVDANQGTLTWQAVVQGQSSSQSAQLPGDFEASKSHNLAVTKKGSVFSFVLDGSVMMEQSLELVNGTSGVIAQNANAHFRNFSIVDR